MKASKMPIHGTSTSLFLSIYAVVFMVFCLKSQVKPKVIQYFIPILPEVGLEDCLLLVILLHLSAATAMESWSLSFLFLELSLPLQSVMFNFSLSFFGLLQCPGVYGPWTPSRWSASLPAAAAGCLVTEWAQRW